jgi:hypothetical protein
VHEGSLEMILFGYHSVHVRLPMLTIEMGVYVGSAHENEPVETRQQLESVVVT